MDLDNLTADMLRQALALYVREAWPDGLPPAKRELVRLRARGTLPEILRESAFVPISLAEEGTRTDIWKLPLGSAVSSRVKMTLKRVSLSDEFLFNVDTHDLYVGRATTEETSPASVLSGSVILAGNPGWMRSITDS